ncbi:hypothetical protein [Viscerimonas tarda]
MKIGCRDDNLFFFIDITSESGFAGFNDLQDTPVAANMSEPLIIPDFFDLHDNRRGEIAVAHCHEWI